MSTTYIPVELRLLVSQRAKNRCEYCRIPEWATLAPHEIDHVIAEKHGGKTNDANLALSCVLCNRRKGTDIASIDPHTGKIVALFHPRRDQWRDHFTLTEGRIDPLTDIGRTTVSLLQFNTPSRETERKLIQVTDAMP